MSLTPNLSHSIEAACLAGADIARTAAAIGVQPRQLAEWRLGEAVPKAHREPLQTFVISLVLGEIARVGRAAVEQPKLIHQEPFRDYLNDLNLAHWLVFGQSFLRYLRQWDQEQNEAQHDERD